MTKRHTEKKEKKNARNVEHSTSKEQVVFAWGLMKTDEDPQTI